MRRKRIGVVVGALMMVSGGGDGGAGGDVDVDDDYALRRLFLSTLPCLIIIVLFFLAL